MHPNYIHPRIFSSNKKDKQKKTLLATWKVIINLTTTRVCLYQMVTYCIYNKNSNKLQTVQCIILRIATGYTLSTNIQRMHDEAIKPSQSQRYTQSSIVVFPLQYSGMHTSSLSYIISTHCRRLRISGYTLSRLYNF